VYEENTPRIIENIASNYLNEVLWKKYWY
jgi:hypothetical protein